MWINPQSLEWLQENPAHRVLQTELRGVPVNGWTPLYSAHPARPVAPAGWIACDERMPDEGAEVLVWVVSAPGNGYATPDQWIEYHEDPTCMGGPTMPMGLMWRDNDPDEVTHWMPRPPPPGTSPAAPAAVALEAPAELRGLDTSTRVRFYEHEFYVLSNFSAFNLQWSGRTFQTSEHAYHWEKFTDPDGALADVRAIQRAIFNAPSAHEAFKIAERNRVHRRPDWEDVKVWIMREILREKARQHEYVRRKLLETGDRELVEDSWRDDFWGWGPNRDGQNMLGRLWMEVRAELRAHGISAPGAEG